MPENRPVHIFSDMLRHEFKRICDDNVHIHRDDHIIINRKWYKVRHVIYNMDKNEYTYILEVNWGLWEE